MKNFVRVAIMAIMILTGSRITLISQSLAAIPTTIFNWWIEGDSLLLLISPSAKLIIVSQTGSQKVLYENSVSYVEVSPDGKWIAVGFTTGELRILSSDESINHRCEATGLVSISWSRSSQILFYSIRSLDGTIQGKVYDIIRKTKKTVYTG